MGNNKNFLPRKKLIAYYEKRLENAKNNLMSYINTETGEVYNKINFSYYNGCVHEILAILETLKTYN